MHKVAEYFIHILLQSSSIFFFIYMYVLSVIKSLIICFRIRKPSVEAGKGLDSTLSPGLISLMKTPLKNANKLYRFISFKVFRLQKFSGIFWKLFNHQWLPLRIAPEMSVRMGEGHCDMNTQLPKLNCFSNI